MFLIELNLDGTISCYPVNLQPTRVMYKIKFISKYFILWTFYGHSECVNIFIEFGFCPSQHEKISFTLIWKSTSNMMIIEHWNHFKAILFCDAQLWSKSSPTSMIADNVPLSLKFIMICLKKLSIQIHTKHHFISTQDFK